MCVYYLGQSVEFKAFRSSCGIPRSTETIEKVIRTCLRRVVYKVVSYIN